MNHEKELRRFPSAPLDHVYLENGYEVSHQTQREFVRYEDVPGLALEIRSKLILKPYRLAGTEIAYLRKRLDLLQRELAPLIGTTEQTLSLWEQGGHMAPASDMLLRLLCATRLRKEITSVAGKLTQEQASRFVEHQGTFRIIARHDDGKWLARFEPQEQTVRERPGAIKISAQGHHLKVLDPHFVQIDRKTNQDTWLAADTLSLCSLYGATEEPAVKHSLKDAVAIARSATGTSVRVLGHKNHVRKYGHETRLAYDEEC